MSVFGHLEHLAFGDLARVLEPQIGTLFLRTALSGRSVEMHLQKGLLLAVFVDGFPIREEQRVIDIVNQLVHQGSGTFDFQSTDATELLHHTTYRLSDLLQRSHTQNVIPETHLPHPETRFISSQRGGVLSSELQRIWQHVEPLLKGGASAVDLARQLRVSEDQARVMLYNLRVASLIMPLRASQVPGAQAQALRTITPVAAPVAPVPITPSPIRRLLGTLRRLTQRVAS